MERKGCVGRAPFLSSILCIFSIVLLIKNIEIYKLMEIIIIKGAETWDEVSVEGLVFSEALWMAANLIASFCLLEHYLWSKNDGMRSIFSWVCYSHLYSTPCHSQSWHGKFCPYPELGEKKYVTIQKLNEVRNVTRQKEAQCRYNS